MVGMVTDESPGESFVGMFLHPAMLVDLTVAKPQELQRVAVGSPHALPLPQNRVRLIALFVPI
jgi:hypothetical protein